MTTTQSISNTAASSKEGVKEPSLVFMNEILQAKQTVLEICQKLSAKGILMGTGGNISVRVQGQKAFAITPSNYDYAKMVVEDICVLDYNLKAIEGERKPSVESSLHAAIYENRLDTNCVIHTHQVYASALALTHTAIPALFDEQIKFLGKSVEIVDYAPSGTPFLKNNVVKRLRNHVLLHSLFGIDRFLPHNQKHWGVLQYKQ